MKTTPIIGLKFCAWVLASLAQRNKRMIENRHWQMATEGLAKLRKDLETLNGYVDNIVEVEFRLEAQAAFEDPRQLNLKLKIQ